MLEGSLKVQVPVESHEVIWSISRMLGLDEVDTFVLWKTFLHNHGLPSSVDPPMDNKILDHFYFEERLSRVFKFS